MLHEYYGIGAGERQPKPTNVRCEQQTIDTGIRIERLHDGVSLVGLSSTV